MMRSPLESLHIQIKIGITASPAIADALNIIIVADIRQIAAIIITIAILITEKVGI